jgi:hypothetical protein
LPGALLAGAGPFNAAAKIDFSGHYRLFQMNYWNQGFEDKDSKSSDSFFANRLQMDFAFHATDEISVYWRLRAPNHQRWGDKSSGITSKHVDNVNSQWFYGEVKQDWGTVAIGRLNDPRTMFGLASLGWAPGGPDVNATNFEPFDLDDSIDGIHYINRWDNGFQLAAGWLRLDSKQVDNGSGGRDETADLFAVEPAFLWDGGGASLGLHYLRDHTDWVETGLLGVDKPALKMFRINPAIAHSFGDFSVHFEGMAGWGSVDGEGSNSDTDVEGYAFYMDVDYNYGPGNINLAGWWAAGNDDGEKVKGIVGFDTFAPLVVAYGATGYGWNRGSYTRGNKAVDAVEVANIYSGNYGNPHANHWGIDLNGAHAFTDDLTLTYALAYLALNKTQEEAEGKGIGVEVDLGLQIQLLDNRHFGTTFGYLFAGDALTDNRTPGNKKEAEDAYTWINTLTFSF